MSVRLRGSVLRSGDDILLPLDFFTTYLKGCSVTFDGESYKITLVRDVITYNVSVSKGRVPVYEPIGFAVKQPQTLSSIAEGSLPADILAQTDPHKPEGGTDADPLTPME